MQVDEPKTRFAGHAKKRQRFDILKLLGTALAVAAIIFALAPLFGSLNRKLGVGPEGFWIRRVIIYGLIGGGYLVFFYWKRFFSRRRPN
jgi:hypothetical protein